MEGKLIFNVDSWEMPIGEWCRLNVRGNFSKRTFRIDTDCGIAIRITENESSSMSFEVGKCEKVEMRGKSFEIMRYGPANPIPRTGIKIYQEANKPKLEKKKTRRKAAAKKNVAS